MPDVDEPRVPLSARRRRDVMNQITKEWYCGSMQRREPLDEMINEFMEEWSEENMGHLTVNGVHEFGRIYPGDGKRADWVLVVFDVNPPSEFEIELARASQRNS